MKKGSKSNSSRSNFRSRASLLARLVGWFDSYVELYTIDPIRIEKRMKGFEGTDIDQIWKSIENDIEKINELPSTSEEIEKYVKASSFARRLSVILTAVTFGFLLFFLYFQNSLKALGGTLTLLIAPGVIIVIMYAALTINTMYTRRLNKAMRVFYNDHAQELRKQTSHIKESAQLLIDKLQREVYSHNFDESDFKFELFHSNYKNIVVVGSRKGRDIATVRPKNPRAK